MQPSDLAHGVTSLSCQKLKDELVAVAVGATDEAGQTKRNRFQHGFQKIQISQHGTHRGYDEKTGGQSPGRARCPRAEDIILK